MLAVAGGLYVAWPLGPSGPSPEAPTAAAAFGIEQLTASGNAGAPAISPDGQFVAYVHTDGTATSLRVRQVTTGSNTELVPPEPDVTVGFPTVTPDGGYVDFVRRAAGDGTTLQRVPFLGGTRTTVVDDISSPIGWSPDGTQMAFIRSDGVQSWLLVAGVDGGGERVLAARERPSLFLNFSIVGGPPVRPVWSPDGRTIALYEIGDFDPRVVFLDASTGAETVRGAHGGFQPRGLAWLGPTSLVLSQPEEEGRQVQLWRMSYPVGAVSPLTNDLNSYVGLDLARTRTSLVTSRLETRASVWVGDAEGASGTSIVPPTLFTGRFLWVSGRATGFSTTPRTRVARRSSRSLPTAALPRRSRRWARICWVVPEPPTAARSCLHDGATVYGPPTVPDGMRSAWRPTPHSTCGSRQTTATSCFSRRGVTSRLPGSSRSTAVSPP